MHRRIFIFTLLLSLSFWVSAINIDSLQLQLHVTNSTNEKIEILNLLSKGYLNKDNNKSKKFAEEALFLSESIQELQGEAEAMYYLALIAIAEDNPFEAMNHLLQSRELFDQLNEELWNAELCFQIGKVYQTWLKYDRALIEYFKALETFKEYNDEEKMAKVFNSIGGIYYDRENYDKAFEYFRNSNVHYNNIKDQQGLAMTYNNLGEIFRLQGNPEEALNYFYTAIKLNKTFSNLKYLAVNYDNIGNTYLLLKEYDSAGEYLSKSLDVSKQINFRSSISMANISFGNYYLAINETGKAMTCFKDAYEIAKADKNIGHEKNAAKGLSDVFLEKGDFKEAYKFFLQFQEKNDSIYKANMSQEITQIEMQLIFEGEQNLSKIQRQKAEIVYFLLAIGLVSLIIIIILLYGRQKIKIKYSIIEAENLELETKHLEEDIAYKNKELATNVMYLLKKNELINNINEELVKLKSGFRKANQPIISDIILQLQSGVDTNTWELFDKWFGEVHKEFYIKLEQSFPKLTTNDKRLCALLRLNMTTKEIAAITNQNPNSIEVARTRLRKKLNISNKEVNLVSFITSL
jgi:tetratricopeptide (TPR) repeat protein